MKTDTFQEIEISVQSGRIMLGKIDLTEEYLEQCKRLGYSNCLDVFDEEGEDIWLEFDLDIEGDYQPEEPAVYYYADGSGYPGCGEELSIYSIKVGDKEIINELSGSFVEYLETYLLETR